MRVVVGLLIVSACAPAPAPRMPEPEAAPEPALVAVPTPAEPVPEASMVPPGALVFHAAITSDTCDLTVHALAGGGVAVLCEGDDEDLYGAAGGQATLTRDEQYRAWLEKDEFDEPRVIGIGGRWPDAMFATVEQIATRATTLEEVVVRKPDGWTEFGVRAPRGRSAFYNDYAGTPDGQVFGLRVQQPATGFYYPTEQYQKAVGKRLPPSPLPHRNDSGRYLDWIGRPAVDRLAGEGPGVPAFPAGTVALELAAGPAGDLYVQVKGGRFLHAAPGARAWKKLPADGEGAPGKQLHIDMMVGLDGRLYVERCPTGGGGEVHRWDGAGWTRLAIPCVSNLTVREDGSVWRVEQHEEEARLERLAEDGSWTAVPVHVPGVTPFVPRWLTAVPGALWLQGEVSPSHEVLATTLAGGTPITLSKQR